MHWTYEVIGNPQGDLEQGDIIYPTVELRDVLGRVHAHFDDDKYLCYCIATQSCDLVRHKDKLTPKARYISIAAVRSLNAVFPSLLEEIEPSIAPGVFREKVKDKARELLLRILNQNEQGLGLFYLHPDAEVGIGQPAVVYLRVTVALKTEHYKILLESRRGRLTAEFRSKFGWLLGNLYSRAATRDWGDSPIDAKQQNDIVKAQLRSSEQEGKGGLLWIDDDLLAGARKKSIDIRAVPREQIVSFLEPHRPKSTFELAVDEVLVAAKEALSIKNEDTRLPSFKARLNSLKKFMK